MEFTDAVTEVIVRLRPGEVAAEAGHPGASRAVGSLLRQTEGLPWWRVVAANGRLVPGSEARQTALLRSEGVTVREGRVVHNPDNDGEAP